MRERGRRRGRERERERERELTNMTTLHLQVYLYNAESAGPGHLPSIRQLTTHLPLRGQHEDRARVVLPHPAHCPSEWQRWYWDRLLHYHTQLQPQGDRGQPQENDAGHGTSRDGKGRQCTVLETHVNFICNGSSVLYVYMSIINIALYFFL